MAVAFLMLTLGIALLPGPAQAVRSDLRAGLMWSEQYGDARHAEMAGASGARVVRLPIRWKGVSPEPPEAPGPTYDWSRYDALIADLARNGVRVMLNLSGTAPWAAETSRSGEPLRRRPPLRTYEPEWRAFARAVVRRYGPRGELWSSHQFEEDPIPYRPVTEYEIWNEPNINVNWREADPSPRDYSRFMVATSRAMRAEQPVRILGASLCYCGRSPEGYLKKVLSTARAREAANGGISLHAYRPNPASVLKAVQTTRSWLKAVDAARMPLHLTEFGWGTCDGLYRQRVCVTPEQQARFITEAFSSLEERNVPLGLSTAYWFLPEDLCESTDARCDHAFFGHFGLLYKGGTPKPGWRAYLRAADRR